MNTPSNLIAVDVGNSRVKLGWFPGIDPECATKAGGSVLPIAGSGLAEPSSTLSATAEELTGGRLTDWLAETAGEASAVVALASVSRPGAEAVAAALADYEIERLTSQAAPIELRVEAPDKVGVDRVLAAVAVNRLRHADKPAIVVDVGTAITVDLVSADGALEGGAILPGPGLAGRALGERTDALPDIRFGDLDASPDAVGRSTESAIRAGVFWGSVGAIRELIARQRDRLTVGPQVFLTGGAAPSIARLIGGPDLTVRYLPNLTLSGVALAARLGEP